MRDHRADNRDQKAPRREIHRDDAQSPRRMADDDRRQLSPSVGHGCYKITSMPKGPLIRENDKTCWPVSSSGRDLTYWDTTGQRQEADKGFQMNE